MSAAIEAQLVDCGVDWITGTGLAGAATEVLVHRFANWMDKETARGMERRAWSMSGYQGFACGSLQCGIRHDGHIFRLGGEWAKRHWKDVFHATRKASRLDLQYTLKFNCDPSRIISRSYRQVKRDKARHPHAPSHSLFSASNQSSTLYLGSRWSERFGRIYDKGRESKAETFRNCVRLEVELKGDAANDYAHKLFTTEDEQRSILSEVCAFMQDRNVSTWLTVDHLPCSHAHRPATDIERKLRWLEVGVRPSVHWLLERIGRQKVLAALGLDHDVELDQKASMAKLDR